MSARALSWAGVLVILVCSSGCMRMGRGVFRVAARVAARVVVAGAIEAVHSYSRERHQPSGWPVASREDPPVTVPGPSVRAEAPVATPAEAPNAPRRFDGARARRDLAAIDMATCSGSHFRGYARGQVQIMPSGAVRNLSLDVPDRPTPALQRCVFEQVRGTRFAPFQGKEMVLGVTWFIP